MLTSQDPLQNQKPTFPCPSSIPADLPNPFLESTVFRPAVAKSFKPATEPPKSPSMENQMVEIAEIMRFQQNLLRLVTHSDSPTETASTAPVAEPADRIELLFRQALSRAS